MGLGWGHTRCCPRAPTGPGVLAGALTATETQAHPQPLSATLPPGGALGMQAPGCRAPLTRACPHQALQLPPRPVSPLPPSSPGRPELLRVSQIRKLFVHVGVYTRGRTRAKQRTCGRVPQALSNASACPALTTCRHACPTLPCASEGLCPPRWDRRGELASGCPRGPVPNLILSLQSGPHAEKLQAPRALRLPCPHLPAEELRPRGAREWGAVWVTSGGCTVLSSDIDISLEGRPSGWNRGLGDGGRSGGRDPCRVVTPCSQ